uniref:Uncharacterized protein n=1 Tax=viral metagenome TaxID=1070528 RepID=A0A6C0I3D3_9ZZZZ
MKILVGLLVNILGTSDEGFRVGCACVVGLGCACVVGLGCACVVGLGCDCTVGLVGELDLL